MEKEVVTVCVYFEVFQNFVLVYIVLFSTAEV